MAAATLRSFEGLGITSADIHVEFDDSTEWAREAFKSFVASLQFQCRYHERRLFTFSDWAESAATLESVEAEQIFVCPTEDHFRVPHGNHEFKRVQEELKRVQAAEPDRIIGVPLSHFPEVGAMMTIARRSFTLLKSGGTTLIPWQIPGGPVLFTKERYGSLFEHDFTRGLPFVGFENARGPSLRLENLFYVSPRTEILRHFDSYGHIGLSNWPYNAVDPNLKFNSISGDFVTDFEFVLSSSLDQPDDELERTVASEHSPQEPQHVRLRMAILKATLLRPSWFTAKWVGSKHGSTRMQVALAFSALLLRHRFFAFRAVSSALFAPVHLVLGLATRISRRQRRLQLFVMWFLSYGSSIGYHRLLVQGLRTQALIRLRAAGIEVGAKPPRKPRQL